MPLAICAVLYGIGVRCRMGAYGSGILRGNVLPGFVVSVGNLTAGGTGKTPAVIMLARWALGQGYRVAILSRGYGAQTRDEVLQVSDGNGTYADARLAGDEPSLLARSVPEVPVVISRDRYRAGMYARKHFGSKMFILDDGFQHLRLKRDLNFLLMDATDPFGNGHLLPWGPLREPLTQLRRADAVILTRFNGDWDENHSVQHAHLKAPYKRATAPWRDEGDGQDVAGSTSPSQRTLAWLKKTYPFIPVFCADHTPDKVVFPRSGAVYGPGVLKERRVVGFAGIAHPERFENTLKGMGAHVIRFLRYHDHYPFTEKDMKALVEVKEETGADCLLTTEKDWMRIAPVAPGYEDLAYVSIRFLMLPDQDEVFRMIKDGQR